MKDPIEDPRAFFHALGDMHDAHVESVQWTPGTVTIAVDDLHASFRGLPGYPGRLRASVEFSGVKDVATEIWPRPWVFGVEIRDDADAAFLMVEIQLSPGGLIRLSCHTVSGDFDWRAVLAGLPIEGGETLP